MPSWAFFFGPEIDVACLYRLESGYKQSFRLTINKLFDIFLSDVLVYDMV